MIGSLISLWQQREPRERRLIALAAGVLAAALVFLLFVEPAVTGIARLERTLPGQRAQVAALDGVLAEARQLKGRATAATAPPGEVRTQLEASLKSAGLAAAKISAGGDGGLQLSFVGVPYSTWAAWLEQAERDTGVRAVAVQAKAAQAGRADIELTLRPARR